LNALALEKGLLMQREFLFQDEKLKSCRGGLLIDFVCRVGHLGVHRYHAIEVGELLVVIEVADELRQ
jgi:hypothetical protein